MIKNIKNYQWLWYLSNLTPLILLVCFLWLGISIKEKVPLLGRKPFSLLIVFASSFWLIWYLWSKLKVESEKFNELYKYIWLYVPFYWSIGFGLYLFTGIGFLGFGPIILTSKEEIVLATGFTSSHIFYFSGWIILSAWLSMSKFAMEKIYNLKRPGHYSIIITIFLCLLMYLNTEKATLPVTYGELSPNLVLFIVEILYLLVFLMILFSLLNKRRITKIMGSISYLIIFLFILLTEIGKDYINVDCQHICPLLCK